MRKRLAVLWPYLSRYRGKLVVGLLATCASVGIGLINPLVVGHAIDALKSSFHAADLALYGGLIVAVSLGQGFFSFIQRMILVGMSRDIEYDLRNDYFAALERHPPGFFHDHPTGDLMARATNDRQAVRMICGPAILYLANTILTGGGAVYFMLRVHRGLALVALAVTPLVALVTQFFGQRIHVLFQRVQERFSDLTARTQESLAGVRVVRAYAQEEHEEAEFDRLNQDYVEANKRLIGWSVSFHPLLSSIIGLAGAAVLWYGGVLVIRGRISIGQLVTFNFFLAKLVWPMIALGWVVNLTQRGLASLSRIQDILRAEPAIRDLPPLVEPREIAGALDLDHLTFAYRPGGPAVLTRVDLHAEAGETVALVGRTGAGKSTLLALIPRLLDPPPGSLRVDGIDVRSLPLAVLRAAIAMVPQETFLFSDTLRANIALGAPQADDAQIADAARVAGLAADLADFPKGLDTMVGERGLTLSGGQKQRVALARAVLRRPRILLLDDCLSAVDTQTEELILKNLRAVFAGRTVLLVSHRVSTVKDADQILVLDGGEVLEKGTHEQLLAGGGLYADLHQRQLLEEELAAV